MTGLLNRPNTWLLFLKNNIQVFIPTVPNNKSEGVCLFVCAACVRESERDKMCVCGKEFFGVGYHSLAI